MMFTNCCKRILLLFSAVSALIFSAGCQTDYGYDYVKNTTTTVVDRRDCNERSFMVVKAHDDEITVDCFRKYDHEETVAERSVVTGKKHYYYSWKPTDYFSESLLNPFKEYESLTGKFFDDYTPLSKSMADLPMSRAFVDGINQSNGNVSDPVVQLILGSILLGTLCADVGAACCLSMIDLTMYLCVPMVDVMAAVGCWAWSAIAMPMTWLGSRLFGWMFDWNLAENPPDVLKMTSYMPFLNLFFIFQTPPYLTSRYYAASRIEKLPVSEQFPLAEVRRINTFAKQEKYTGCQLIAKLFCDGEEFAAAEFITDSSGEVKLGKFVREALKNLPEEKFASENISLELQLEENGVGITRRILIISKDSIMSKSSRNDLALYESSSVDELNKILLRKRSHRQWRKPLLDEMLRDFQQKYDEYHPAQ